MKKYTLTISLILRLFLGTIMIIAGSGKFLKTSPTPLEVVEKASNDDIKSNTSTLQKVLYINGLKQTGFFWETVAICELLFGIFLILYRTYFIGALFLLPITLQIFLFHLFLEADEVGELLYCGLLLGINISLIFIEKDRWKSLFNQFGPIKNIRAEFFGNY
mgnify:FL=1